MVDSDPDGEPGIRSPRSGMPLRANSSRPLTIRMFFPGRALFRMVLASLRQAQKMGGVFRQALGCRVCKLIASFPHQRSVWHRGVSSDGARILTASLTKPPISGSASGPSHRLLCSSDAVTNVGFSRRCSYPYSVCNNTANLLDVPRASSSLPCSS